MALSEEEHQRQVDELKAAYGKGGRRGRRAQLRVFLRQEEARLAITRARLGLPDPPKPVSALRRRIRLLRGRN